MRAGTSHQGFRAQEPINGRAFLVGICILFAQRWPSWRSAPLARGEGQRGWRQRKILRVADLRSNPRSRKRGFRSQGSYVVATSSKGSKLNPCTRALNGYGPELRFERAAVERGLRSWLDHFAGPNSTHRYPIFSGPTLRTFFQGSPRKSRRFSVEFFPPKCRTLAGGSFSKTGLRIHHSPPTLVTGAAGPASQFPIDP